MAMAGFLAVPLKKTSEIDLVKPLKNVFSGFCVSADEPVNYDNALSELNKLRMNSTWRTLDKHESSLDVMTRYYDQLNFLDAKCPSVDFQISFKWKDAFVKGGFFLSASNLTLSTLAYEKTCILFNIGAMQSQVACSHFCDTKNDEGLKSAAKYFQMSSGTFQYLKSLVSSAGIADPTPDLRSDTLSALQSLMLAQAQESFFFKATSDKMKDSVIAKVASRSEELYGETLKLMEKESLTNVLDKDWLSVVEGKQLVFQALAEYYQSLVSRAKKDVGDEIARLKKAMDLMKSAEFMGVIFSDFKDYVSKITHNYEESKKDNDFIYHARVPDYKQLPPVGKAALAKPILPGEKIPGEKLNENSQDMFSALLPMAVQQAMSAFDLRKIEIVNGEKAKMQSETQMLNGILASLNLPAAIEDTTGNCIPQSLKEKSAAIRERGGLETIQYLLSELPSLLQRNSEILKECERMMTDEEESDNELRSKFGSNWVRTPSSKLNEPLKTNLQKYKQIISTAMSADGIVKEKYEKHREKIALLCLPEDQLLSSIPTGNPVASCSSVEQLKHLMREVHALKSEREVLMGEIESASIDMKAKFLSALSAQGGVNEEALSVETLGEIYGPIQKRIRDNISKQEQLVHDIQTANNEFSREKSSDGSGTRRESMLSDLASAHDAYMELMENLEEGSKFYNNLTEVLVNFQNKINDFCFARKTERDELCKDLQKNIVNVATHSSPLQPPNTDSSKPKPARPPPPKTGEPANMAPSNWNVPAAFKPNEPVAPPHMSMPQGQPEAHLPYPPTYPAYPYPYPAAPYNPYGQIAMPPFPPAPGYQGQPQQPYPYPPTGSYPPAYPQQYPYPQQQYRPQ